MSCRGYVLAFGFVAGLAAPGIAQEAPPASAVAQPPAVPDRVAALKASLQASAAALRQYEWIETTTTWMKEEEKGKSQNRCYYGADGKLQKVPIGTTGEGKTPGGLRGKIAANKKEDVKESVGEAIALLKLYIPPEAAKIQAAKEASRLSLRPPDARGMAHVDIKDYLKAGDTLSIEMDAASNRLEGFAVTSFTEGEKDAVTLNVDFGSLTDGSTYAEKIVLEVKVQNLKLDIENSGYRKLGS